jgi:hypothetical protein
MTLISPFKTRKFTVYNMKVLYSTDYPRGLYARVWYKSSTSCERLLKIFQVQVSGVGNLNKLLQITYGTRKSSGFTQEVKNCMPTKRYIIYLDTFYLCECRF